MSFLVFDSVSKRYGATHAVRDVSLRVDEGSFLTLLGPSGSGKTTLLMMLSGFERPDSGRILLGSRDITRLEPARRGFGVVFQGYALFPHLSVFENVAFALRLRKLPRAALHQRVERMLALVKLTGFEGRLPKELSGGQQQRVAFARALASDPPVLLLDEPLSALDRILREEMQSEIKALHREVGKTFVYVTHDQTEALAMSTHVAVVNQGGIAQHGTPEELYFRPRSAFVATFLGGANLLAVRTDGEPPGEAVFEGMRIRVADAAGGDVGGAHALSLRHEAIRLGADGAGCYENRVPVTIRNADFHGDAYTIEAETAGGTRLVLRTRREDYRGLDRGGPLFACWNGSDAVWVRR